MSCDPRRFELLVEPSRYSDAAVLLATGLPAAVAALQQLTQLTALAFEAGAEDSDESAPVPMPPLAAVPALLRLDVKYLALPPPDLRRLSTLRDLSVCEEFAWGTEPLTGLTALTSLTAWWSDLPNPELLASLPHLAQVSARGATRAWASSLAARLPHVAISENW